MSCAPAQMQGSSPDQGEMPSGPGGSGANVGSVIDALQPQQGNACSCDSCSSVSPPVVALPLQAYAAPAAVPQTLAVVESVDREPLVPPPQAHS